MIRLYKNNAYQWVEKDNVYTIGYAFYQGKLYENEKFTELVIKMKKNIKEEIKEITGYFAIVIKNELEVILISDIIRSFPIFYNELGDITDDIELLKGRLNELSLKELEHTRWISCDDTIYEGVKQLENAQIVIIKNKQIIKQKYFEYHYIDEKQYSFDELDELFNYITEKMIKYLNGKTAVIPLSGGYDSRLLLYYIKKHGYKNIITYTYGNKNGGEVVVSKKVAKFLNVPWYFIEYMKKNCRQKYNNTKAFSDISQYLGRGYSIPHIQEWEAIDILVKRKIIDKNCVIIPGFTLDFITGSHLFSEFIDNDNVLKKIISEKIYINNYNLTKENNNIFNDKLEQKFKIKFNNELIKGKEASEIYETYDFEERQVKFITNAVRIYDYYGMKWYLPFWEKDLILFWNKVSLKDRYKRRYFIDFVNYKYKELMDYAPIYKKDNKECEKKISLLWKIYDIYNNNPLNFYYYFKFRKYLKYVLCEKNFKYDYYIAKDYIKYVSKNNKI